MGSKLGLLPGPISLMMVINVLVGFIYTYNNTTSNDKRIRFCKKFISNLIKEFIAVYSTVYFGSNGLFSPSVSCTFYSLAEVKTNHAR